MLAIFLELWILFDDDRGRVWVNHHVEGPLRAVVGHARVQTRRPNITHHDVSYRW